MDSSSIEIIKYTPDLKSVWNNFVESSKNGTFLFNRAYMDYHSDRFQDNSYIFFLKEKPYCLFPACRKENVLSSHAGLTYGGLIMDKACTASGILNVFSLLLRSAKEEGINEIIYRPVPYIYHIVPSEEDLYALFRNEAILTGRNISSTVDLHRLIKARKDRTASVKKAFRNDVYVRESKDYESFWKILEDNLAMTHGVKPVHSLEEFKKLVQDFPDNIKLWGAFKNDRMIGGVICYYTKNTVHTQYISASPEGKKYGAIDIIITFLIEYRLIEENPGIRYFDLGTSNLGYGRILNESLIYQKEGFGGRAVCFDTYKIIL